jgi:hypothetical protein
LVPIRAELQHAFCLPDFQNPNFSRRNDTIGPTLSVSQFSKNSELFRFLRLPIFGSPQIKNPEGCPTTTRKGNVFPLQKLQPFNLPAITSRNPHHYGPLTPVASALIPLPSDSV